MVRINYGGKIVELPTRIASASTKDAIRDIRDDLGEQIDLMNADLDAKRFEMAKSLKCLVEDQVEGTIEIDEAKFGAVPANKIPKEWRDRERLLMRAIEVMSDRFWLAMARAIIDPERVNNAALRELIEQPVLDSEGNVTPFWASQDVRSLEDDCKTFRERNRL
jgi:hypothetical protein